MSIAAQFRQPLGSGNLLPTSNDGDGYKVDQYFDILNRDINRPNGSYHLGVDWNGDGGGNSDLGDAVFAVADAEVVKVVSGKNGTTTGFGNYVILRHELADPVTINGITSNHVNSLYAHLDSVAALKVGQSVSIGQPIGTLGNSGATGGIAHLHFEMTIGDVLPDADDGYNPSGAPAAWLEPIGSIARLNQDTGGGIGNDVVLPVGSPFLVNTTTEDMQWAPAVAVLEDSKFVATWADYSEALYTNGNQNERLADIRGQIFNNDGTKFGTEFIVNSTTRAEQSFPNIRGLANGGFVISWIDSSEAGADNSGTSIRARIFEPDGTPLESDFIVNSTTNGSQRNPEIVALSNGRFLVGWTDYGEANGLVRAQMFDSKGNELGNEILITEEDKDSFVVGIVELPNGRTLVAYGQVHTDSYDYEIRAKILENDGITLREEIQISNVEMLATDAYSGLDHLSDGRFIVSWLSNDANDVSVRVFNPDGSPNTDEIVVGSTNNAAHFGTVVVSLKGGGFVVAWGQYRDREQQIDHLFKGQLFSNEGEKVGSEFFLVESELLALGAVDQNKFVALGSDFEGTSLGDDSGTHISAQIFEFGSIAEKNDFVPWGEETTYTLRVGGKVEGAIEADGMNGPNATVDKDWYRVSLEGGKTYEFSGTAGVSQADSLDQIAMRLYWDNEHSATQLVEGAFTGFNFTAPGSGAIDVWLAVSAGGPGNWEEDTGAYQISVIEKSPVDLISPNIQKLELAAKVVAYQGSLHGTDKLTGYRILESDRLEFGTFAAYGLTSDAGTPILAIRGTTRNTQDWLVNGDHRAPGYTEAIESYPKIKAWLQTHPNTSIVGHSQGGAEAQMFAAWATRDGIEIDKVFTFNSPGISAIDAQSFDPLKAGDVQHFISSGDMVSLAGDQFINGDAVIYNFDQFQGLNFEPFNMIIDAHTSRTGAIPGSYVPLKAPPSHEVVFTTSADLLSNGEFTYLGAGGRTDAQYFALLLGLSSLGAAGAAVGQSLKIPSTLSWVTVGYKLMSREGTEELRKQFGDFFQTLAETISFVKNDLPESIREKCLAAYETIIEWGANAAQIVDWDYDTWKDVTQNFTTEVWDSISGWGSAAIASIAEFGSKAIEAMPEWSPFDFIRPLADILQLTASDTVIDTGAGNDQVTSSFGNQMIESGFGNDTVIDFCGINDISDRDGDDVLTGGFQSDKISGGLGDDRIRGDASVIFGGSDILIGGPGNDTLMGGKGADVFVFRPNEGSDVIASFGKNIRNLLPRTSGVETEQNADFVHEIDRIQLESFSEINSSNVMSYVSDSADGVVFEAEGTKIVFYGLSADMLTADDFVFV